LKQWNRFRHCGKVRAEGTVVPEPDTLLGGKYRIVRVLGQGGMGAVYEVEHVLTLKRAAIKRVHPHLVAHDKKQTRVLREARAAARVRHRNVVDVYDVLSEGDSVCLVMELLVGEPLSAWVQRGGHALHEFVALLLPAMEGAAAAHAAGVVHRDLKPENIFLAEEPGAPRLPKVIDFGISKLVGPDTQVTHSGVTMGTPRYASYEQVANATDVDARADVYAFGVMLYEAVTGRAPYNASTFGQQAIAFATTRPARPRDLVSGVPEALERIVMRAIARDRDDRTASLLELHDALAPFALPETYAAPLAAFPRSVATAAPLAAAATPVPLTTRPLARVGRWLAVALLVAIAVAGWRLTARAPGAEPLPEPPRASQQLGPAPAADTPLPAPQPDQAPQRHAADIEPSPQPPATRVLAGKPRAATRAAEPPPAAPVDAPAPPVGEAAPAVHRAGRLTHDQF
jgi:tRNA A-37 threonylcarbamoyl transferase component Bud32